MAETLKSCFTACGRRRLYPKEFKDASIINVYKQKGNAKVCDNHRGVSLLSTAGEDTGKSPSESPKWLS